MDPTSIQNIIIGFNLLLTIFLAYLANNSRKRVQDEKDSEDLQNKVSELDKDFAIICTRINTLEKVIEKLDQKVDKILDLL